MNYNEFGNTNEKRKIKNVIWGTLGVVGTLIVFVTIFLLVSKYMKKDNEVDKEKNTYTVTIKNNGANVKDTTLSCYSFTTSCQINLPIITRSGWQIIGWATSEKAKELEYTSGEVITISENITLYAITAKSVSISLVDRQEGEEKLSCGMYNTENKCTINLPNKGKGWNEDINGTEPTYLPGQKLEVSEYKRLYYIK